MSVSLRLMLGGGLFPTVSKALLTGLALTAAASLTASHALAASFDDVDQTESVLLNDSEQSNLAASPPAAEQANEPETGESSAEPMFAGCTDLSCTTGLSGGCVGSSGQPCSCSNCSEPDGLINRIRSHHAGKMIDSDPLGLLQRLGRLHDKSGACWSGRADLLLLWRNAPPAQPLISAYNPATSTIGGTVFDASDLESTLAAGPRFTLMRTNPCGHGIESTYFRAFNFRSQEQLPIVPDGYALTPPGAFGNSFTALSGAGANLGSGIQSFELNGRRQVAKNLSLLAGFRWVEWRESLTLGDAAVDPGTGDVAFDDYSTNCMNSLYGGQIGFDTHLVQLGSWLRVDSWMKGGAYYNNAVQTSSYTTGVVGGAVDPTIQTSAQVGAAAFVGELGMMGTIPITRNLDFQFGYLGLWLESLAQPTNQVFGQTLTANQPPAGSITTTGGTVVQGLTLGLQGRW